MKYKFYLTSVVMCIFIFSTYAQVDTIWFDTNWKKTVKNNASFYRANVQKKANGFWIVDYYMSGSKQMEGISKQEDYEIFDGVVRWYHENGNLFQIVNYDEGILNGNRKVFYKNGKLKNETNYKKDKIEGKWKEFYENSKLKESGEYKDGQKEGYWKTYYKNGKVQSEGKYVFDKKVDTWKVHYYDGTLQE